MRELLKLQVGMDEMPDVLERIIFNNRQIKIIMAVNIKYGNMSFAAYINDQYVTQSRSSKLDVTLSVLNNVLSYIELDVNKALENM